MASLWLGVATFLAVSYGAALFSVRWAVLPVAALLFYFFWRYAYRRFYPSRTYYPHWFLVPVAVLFSLSVTTSGWMGKEGLVLRGVNSVDGIWNLALIEELKHSFPPQHPGIAGVPLQGYHFLYNLLAADISRITGVSPVTLHFHVLPVIMALLLVYGIYDFTVRLTGKKKTSMWATFFAVFGGSFAYVLPLFWGKSVSLDDAFGITQPFSLLVSPSFILSLVSIIYTWIFMDMYDKRPSWRWGALVGALAGLSVGMKVYAGMILLPTVGWFVLMRLTKKHDLKSLLIAVAAGVSAAVVFLPQNASYGFLRYQPLWPPHRVMQGVLDFTQWELKRQTLESMRATLGLWKLELIALAIFIVGNLGTRLVGLMGLAFTKSLPRTNLYWMLLVASLISFVLPMFFLQPIGAFNMIQFFWYFLVFVGIFAGWGWSLVLSRFSRGWKIAVSVIMIAITIPSAAEKFFSFFVGSPYMITKEEMTFYQKMRQEGKPGDMVLAVPRIDRYTEADIHDWFYRTGPSITAFSGKRSFLANEVVQFPYDGWIKPRVRLLNIFLLGFNDQLSEGEKQGEALKQLQTLQEKYSIDYIVVPKGVQPWFIGRPWLHFIFANDYSAIYQVSGLPQ